MLKKSAKLRRFEGGHKSTIKTEPQPQTTPPRKPRGLGMDASRLWAVLIPQLQKLGLATAIDEVALVCLVQWWQVYCDAQKTLAQVEDLSSIAGTRALNAASKSFDNFRRLALQFGLSPVARTAINLELQVDDFGDKFFER